MRGVAILGSTGSIGKSALAVLGRILLTSGTPGRAEPSAREAMDALDALGGVEEGESYVRLAFAESLEASGDREAARAAIAAARVRILERAAMIHDPAWKESFLQLVSENARILELAREWRVA